MAFFELLRTVSAAVGSLFKPVGGRAMDSFDPDPWAHVPSLGLDQGDLMALDSAGHVHTRGPVYTDEGSFRSDFPGADLITSLTGTCTFTNGGTSVIGVGTLFLSELNTDSKVRRSVDANDKLARVNRVISDTELELVDPYTGSSGGGAAVWSYWVIDITGGASYSVASSSLTLNSSTANANKACIRRTVDYLPLVYTARASISQRIANQVGRLGFMSDESLTERAQVEFDGTTNTTAKFITSSSAAAADIQTTTFTLPFGLISSSVITYSIVLAPFSAVLLVEGIEAARHTFHLPNPYTGMLVETEIQNTGIAASNTTLVADYILVSNQDQVQVVNSFRSDPVVTQYGEDFHYITGRLQSGSAVADQVVVSTTIPAGKVAYLKCWSLSVDAGTADGLPVKIGRSATPGDPAGPGVVDGLCFLTFSLINSGQREGQDYGAAPIPMARGGDTLALVVTPSGAGATVWRGQLIYSLRSA